MNLLSLYNWCLDCIRKQEYKQAKQTLVELREAWITIENQMNAPKPQQFQPEYQWLFAQPDERNEITVVTQSIRSGNNRQWGQSGGVSDSPFLSRDFYTSFISLLLPLQRRHVNLLSESE